MSLRGRLLLAILLLNAGVLVAVQAASAILQAQELRQRERFYAGLLPAVLSGAYSPYSTGSRQRVLRLLTSPNIAHYFDDVLITNGRSPSTPGAVDLNLLGAAHRDPERFSVEEVRTGIRRAMESGERVAAGGGFCIPISARGEVVAGAWYVPAVAPSAVLPFWMVALPVVLSTVVFGVLAFYTIERSVVRPLRRLGAAAARMGSGDYGVRVEGVPRTPELAVLVDAFDSMAEKVSGHTEELEREVRRATEEARRKERALVISSRLASMGTLAAGIAHEINNPIGGMLNAVHTLLRVEGLSERDRRYLELVRDGLERVAHIARRVLDFMPREIRAAPFDLRDAVAGARGLVEHRLRRADVEFHVDIPEDLPPLVGDRHEVQQVLLNFFLNSVDAMEGAEGPRRISVSARARGHWIELRVEDTGPGIDTELLDRVLDPFFSRKSRPDASGLGMFISYSIIRNHGGELELDSAPGRGFRILVRWPRHDEDPSS